MMTLFQMATTVGWADIMYTGMAVRDVNETPVAKSQPGWAFFFIAFIIVGSFFILNLFVGIVISTFNREKERLGRSFLLTDKQKEWLDIKLLLFRSKPKKVYQSHSNAARKFLYAVQNSPKFDAFIMICIIINTAILMVEWYNQPSYISDITEIINYIFAGIFTVEAIIKISGLGKHYFKDRWNLFDFIVVLGTAAGIAISHLTTVAVGSSATIIRSFRIFRVFRLIKRARSLKLMFNTLVATLPAMANVGGLLALFLFLYSVLGVNLFASVKLEAPLHDNANFQTFWYAFLTLLRVSTGENWHEILNAVTRSNSLLFQCVENPTYEDYVENGSKVF